MKPSIEVTAKLADYLDVSLDYLVGATDQLADKKHLIGCRNYKTCLVISKKRYTTLLTCPYGIMKLKPLIPNEKSPTLMMSFRFLES